MKTFLFIFDGFGKVSDGFAVNLRRVPSCAGVQARPPKTKRPGLSRDLLAMASEPKSYGRAREISRSSARHIGGAAELQLVHGVEADDLALSRGSTV